ncbi:MAG: MFS transporter [Desulfobulbaceae bacterium]|nr:MFS transporter [Desulfobulbaceae bacterium]
MGSAITDKKAIFGWAMYDWANSAFATTIMAGFFPVFFKQYWSAGVDATMSTARLGGANTIASIIVALSAPLLGAIADKGSAKKKFLFFFASMGMVMTSCLYLVSQGNWLLAVALYIFACIGFSSANIFYDSLITAITSDDKMDLVSAMGFGLGYLGGGILFAFNVWMTLQPHDFGFTGPSDAVRFSFLSVAIWWAIFSIPIFLFVKEPETSPVNESVMGIIKSGFKQFSHTYQEIRQLKTVFLFLIAYWLYIDGVDTIVRMAIDYGLSIGLQQTDLIKALLITQFVGFPCAIGFGYLGAKIGTKRAIFIAIAIYLFVSIWAAFITQESEFYVLAVIIGLVQGGIQALSRSFFARIIPKKSSAEYFGFYNMLGKFAAVIGPLLIGMTGLLVKSMGYSDDISSRISIVSISLLFLAGGILFYFVSEEKAQEQLQRYKTQRS